ncbi:Uncharacterised protein [Corynebacterium kutscheri]|uniref:Uncharacterized protein n=1 Tax=Corynebacterium kutscheri TaxID=35755 RepID=A0A0F6TDP6_9CORY|nr:hypothetical protein [Corynebacterium kutscheri]AKE41401.1 hypothetical protein UL82_06175 [Corynebacterium kutscheri]VEH08678.1 Uncharacterised protein [Corynebacterium kutscheri]VEH09725.1 Uncharacterised protein [Corynebacterium kutscheri]VEH79808.1 Uncharacterised protein [Corynebacterium kutscheri]
MSTDLLSLGMKFDKWQDAVEAAIATNKLTVTGEVRGGQLIQYSDSSGAQINILAVEPFATFAGFESVALSFGHVSMINDVLALCEIVDYNDQPVTTVTLNLAQGPLLIDEPEQRWQQVAVTALATDVAYYETVADFEETTGNKVGTLTSLGAQKINDGATTPDASATFSARVLEADYRTNSLTGERFIHATVDGSFAFDVCLPDTIELPVKNSVLAGSAVMVGSIIAPQGCGSGGGGCGSGGCGCGH